MKNIQIWIIVLATVLIPIPIVACAEDNNPLLKKTVLTSMEANTPGVSVISTDMKISHFFGKIIGAKVALGRKTVDVNDYLASVQSEKGDLVAFFCDLRGKGKIHVAYIPK